jgi:hypothetical protein
MVLILIQAVQSVESNVFIRSNGSNRIHNHWLRMIVSRFSGLHFGCNLIQDRLLVLNGWRRRNTLLLVYDAASNWNDNLLNTLKHQSAVVDWLCHLCFISNNLVTNRIRNIRRCIFAIHCSVQFLASSTDCQYLFLIVVIIVLLNQNWISPSLWHHCGWLL